MDEPIRVANFPNINRLTIGLIIAHVFLIKTLCYDPMRAKMPGYVYWR